MKKNFTLYDLLSIIEASSFNLLEKIKIYTISSPSLMDRLTADVEEYYYHDIPYYLLTKQVFKAYPFENTIEVFK